MKNMKFEDSTYRRRIAGLLPGVIALLVCFMVTGLTSAQEAGQKPSVSRPKPGAAVGIPTKKSVIPGLPNIVNLPGKTVNFDAASSLKLDIDISKILYSPAPRPIAQSRLEGTSGKTVRTITLDQAQRQAAQADNPMVRLGELSIEVAKQVRRGVQAQFLPSISGTFVNFHFNKQTGKVNVPQPFMGGTRTVPVNIIERDLTLLNFNVIQPITPIFQLQQAVKIARADENIAKAKAGVPISKKAQSVQTTFFQLLISQRELTVARMKAPMSEDTYVRVSDSKGPQRPAEKESEMFGAGKTLVLAKSKVEELTVSLNRLLGFPDDTELKLVAPAPLVEEITLGEATRKAMETNLAVIEAEQTAIKARAGRRLAKLAYMPEVAILAGYVLNKKAIRVILPTDFAYIGVMATINIFDGGKREYLVKQRKAQVEMAEIAVELQKAKAAKDVKTSFFRMNRLRNLSQLARRMASESRITNAGYKPGSMEVIEARAAMEAKTFRAELAYREEVSRLKQLMGVPLN